MIFLSKNGDDEYIDMYAHGLGQQPTPLETWRYEDSTEPLMLRGIMKHKIIKQCWADGRPFRYMDSGYWAIGQDSTIHMDGNCGIALCPTTCNTIK
jgi:hypothetical protein